MTGRNAHADRLIRRYRLFGLLFLVIAIINVFGHQNAATSGCVCTSFVCYAAGDILERLR